MPSDLHRVQVLFDPDLEALVRTIAKMERRSMSAMAAEMIGAAARLPKYRAILEEAEEQNAVVPPKKDTRTRVPQRMTVNESHHEDSEERRNLKKEAWKAADKLRALGKPGIPPVHLENMSDYSMKQLIANLVQIEVAKALEDAKAETEPATQSASKLTIEQAKQLREQAKAFEEIQAEENKSSKQSTKETNGTTLEKQTKRTRQSH